MADYLSLQEIRDRMLANLPAGIEFKSRISGHRGWVGSVAYSPDGGKIVSGGADGTIRMWNAETGEAIRILEGHKGWVGSVAYSPDGRRIVSGGEYGTVRQWDADTGTAIQTLEGHKGWVSTVAYSPDGSRIVSTGADGTIRQWDADTGKAIRTLRGHAGPVYAVAYSPDGSRIVSSGADGTIRLWDVDTGKAIRTLEGHKGIVYTVAYSPDGSRIVSSSADGTIRQWDADTGTATRTLEGHKGIVYTVAFSPDGSRIVSSGADGTVRQWYADTGTAIQTLEGHKRWVHAATFSPDGSQIVSSGADGTVRQWDADTGKSIQTLEGHKGWVHAATFSPDGSRIVSSGADGTIRLWDVDTGKAIRTLEGHKGIVYTVAYSPDGSRIVSSSADGTIRQWDADTGTATRTLEGHKGIVYTVAFSPDGSRIVSSGADGTVRQWYADTGTAIQTLEGHKGWVYAVAYSPDGSRIVSSGADGTVRLWDAQTGKAIRTLRGNSGVVYAAAYSPDGLQVVSGGADGTVRQWRANTGKAIRTLKGHKGWVHAATYSSDGSRIVSSGADGTVRQWHANTGKAIQTLEGHKGIVYTVAYSPDGSRIVSSGADGTVRQWHANTGTAIQTLEGHKGWVTAVTFSPDGRGLVSGGEDGTIRQWDADTGKSIQTLEGHAGPVNAVAFSPDGSRIVSGGGDGTVRLWDADSGKAIQTLEGHTGSVTSVAYSPDSSRIVSGGNDGTVRLWDADSGKASRTLEGHTGWVYAVAFSPDGSPIVSGGDDGTVRLWDADTGKAIRTLEGHTGWVRSVAFSPDGSRIVSGGGDGTVRLWDADSGKAISTLEGHTGWVISVAFSPDGSLLISITQFGEVAIRSAETMQVIASIPSEVVDNSYRGLAFHPKLPVLAIIGISPTAAEIGIAQAVNLYEYDVNLLLRKAPAVATTSYCSAKVVLVGESNVGKSCLAMRLVEDRFPDEAERGSTHGMRLWMLEPEQLSPDTDVPVGARREVFLWDMGGQDEYRLVHQLFLRDTTIALILLDPTRGRAAFSDARDWNQRLKKQLGGKITIKLLVGAQMDTENAGLDRQSLEALQQECGIHGFIETSALTGRGIAALKAALASAINWAALAPTDRPELFQRIRDEIEMRRKRGDVIVYDRNLMQAVGEEDEPAVQTVANQLALQGAVVRSRVSTGEPVLVLQIAEVERYAGSLIVAAKTNPRGVPGLELAAIMRPGFPLPRLGKQMERHLEIPVLECTVQLLIEHGICFQHQGLLIFPTCFPDTGDATTGDTLTHSVSLYYDFSGAIDNVYASLVTTLVLAESFGRVRLWAERAEFNVADSGLCGVRKVPRPGGYAHIDVYFNATTSEETRSLFISFVEDHLRQHDIEIREYLAIKSVCGYEFDEQLVRERIAMGKKGITCPRCDERCEILEGAVQRRQRDEKLALKTSALRTEVERKRAAVTRKAVDVMQTTQHVKADPATPIRILHLSDLHFTGATTVDASLRWLLEDLQYNLKIPRLDYLVVSGDFTDKGNTDGFVHASKFLSGLCAEKDLGLTSERCILIPGNHDVAEPEDAYRRQRDVNGLKPEEWIDLGHGVKMARDPEKYPNRFEPFNRLLYHPFIQKDYPLKFAEQGLSTPFWLGSFGIQFIGLNSCWQLDEFDRKRSGILPEAVAHAIKQARTQENLAIASGDLQAGAPVLKIAVWHHAIAGPEQMRNTDFLGLLQNFGVRLALHGDVHELRRDLVGYWLQKKMHIAGSGSFSAPAEGRPEATPRLYNVIEIARDLKSALIHTREQRRADGAWQGWHEWPNLNGDGQVPHYTIDWERKE